jgi:ABC-type uncharacterized transport system ATPase subunit
VDNIREKMTKTIDVVFETPPSADELTGEGVDSVKEDNGRFRIQVSGDLSPVLQRISTHKIRTFDYHKMTLEEIFKKYFEKNSD